jgi:hypothetical protein
VAEAMNATLKVDCPRELLMGLHTSAEELAEDLKSFGALALFRKGRISSGMAAKWLTIPRVQFLLMAMAEGVELLENTQDDYNRETALL